MAYSEYPTRLSLDRFAAIAGIHPLHFSQLRTPNAFAGGRSVGCDSVIYQHRYQSSGGVPGRNDIARAIFEAERDLEAYLHFPLIQTWIADEPISLPLPFHGPDLHSYASRWYGQIVKTHNAHVSGGGVRAVALLLEGASGTRSDEDGDDYEETVTFGPIAVDDATIAAVLDAEEFRLFYPEKGPDPLWEIRPVRVLYEPTLSQVTLTVNISQLVDPDLYERMVPEALDPDGSDVFLTSVDVYRVYTDLTAAGIYRARCGSTDLITTGTVIRVEDPEGGVVRVYPRINNCSCARPSELLSYVSGYPRSTFTTMDHAFERAVVALALSRLGGICGCKGIPDFSRDLSVVAQGNSNLGNSEMTRWAVKPPDNVMKNPFGTLEGARIAWEVIAPQIAGETANDYL